MKDTCPYRWTNRATVVNFAPKTLGANKARLFKTCRIKPSDKDKANEFFMMLWAKNAHRGFHAVANMFRFYAKSVF